MKLSIELVPKSCWYTNVRTNVDKEEWDRLRKACYAKADYKCKICGGKGKKWPVECHEIWEYDDIVKTQTLKGLIALCPLCHQVKHYGYSEHKGKEKKTKKHLMKVNEWTLPQANAYIENVFMLYASRSKVNWILDTSILNTL